MIPYVRKWVVVQKGFDARENSDQDLHFQGVLPNGSAYGRFAGTG